MLHQHYSCFFMEMVTRSHTKIKAFRLETSLILSLERVARRLHISDNMYVTRVLTRALMIEPLVPVFDGIELAEETFASLLSTANRDSLEVDGFALGEKELHNGSGTLRKHWHSSYIHPVPDKNTCGSRELVHD